MENIKYKDSGVSWIGMIPDDWKVVKLGDVADFIKGIAFKSGDMGESSRYIVKTTDIDESGINWNKVTGYTGNDNIDKVKIINDDILMGLVGSVGKVMIVKDLGTEAYLNQNATIIRAKKNVAISDYIYQTVRIPEFLKYATSKATGGTLKFISMETLTNYMIPLPPLDQQELIAGYLDEQSRKQSLLKHSDLITQLKNYKTSIISEYVTGKKSLDNKPVAMKDSGIDWIGEIPAHWDVKKVQDFADITCGKYNAGDYTEDGEYPFFTATTSDAIKNIDTYSFDCEAVLMARNGLAGFAKFYSGKFEISNHCFAITSKSNINMRFLYYYLVGSSSRLNEMVNGVAIPGIKKTSIAALELLIPPLSEQEAIAAKLDAVITELDSVVANSEKIVAELKAYKSAVITEFITGQKLVPGFDNAERERERVSSNIPWIGMIPSDWKVATIGKLITVLPKSGLPAGEGMESGEYPFYTCSQLCSKRYNTYHFEPDAITMSTGGKASVNYVDERWTSSQDCYNFRTNQFTKFVYYALYCNLDVINDAYFKGAGLKHLQKKDLNNFNIPLPSMQEQQVIAQYLDSETSKIDNQIQYYESLITELKSFKQAIISEAVTGKINN